MQCAAVCAGGSVQCAGGGAGVMLELVPVGPAMNKMPRLIVH